MFFRPLISWKIRTPQNSEAMAPGIVVTMGNETGSESTLFAINQQAVAIPHMTPEAIAGNMTRGYTLGLFFLIAM